MASNKKMKQGMPKCREYAGNIKIKKRNVMKRVSPCPPNIPQYGISYGTLGLRKCTLDEILEAVHVCRGKIYKICQKLEITPPTLLNYRKEYPEIDDAINYIKGNYVDMTEDVLLECALVNKEEWAIKYTLGNWGRDRKWADMTKVQVGGDADSPPIRTENNSVNLVDLGLPKEVMEMIYEKMIEKRNQLRDKQS